MRILILPSIALFSLIGLTTQAAGAEGTWLQLAAKGPGTQTEDELYVGAHVKPDAAKNSQHQAAQEKQSQTMESPAYKALPPSKKAEPAKQMKQSAKPLKSGDEDLEDLEIQRSR